NAVQDHPDVHRGKMDSGASPAEPGRARHRSSHSGEVALGTRQRSFVHFDKRLATAPPPSSPLACSSTRCLPRLRRGNRHPCLDQLAHERGWKWVLGLKADGALAGLVTRELLRERLHDAARIKSAMIRTGSKPNEHSPVEPESRELIADAFFGAGRDRPD